MRRREGSSSESDVGQAPPVKPNKVTKRKNKTSTPVTVGKWVKRKKTKRVITASKMKNNLALEKVRKNLDGAVNVSLSTNSSDGGENDEADNFESTCSSLRECIKEGLLGESSLSHVESPNGHNPDENRVPRSYSLSGNSVIEKSDYNDERACPAKYISPIGGYNNLKRACPAKYQDATVAAAFTERACPAKYQDRSMASTSEGKRQSWMDSTDPVMEQVLLGLTDRDMVFSNHFILSQHIDDVLRSQAD